MATAYKTPGVYVEEISVFPPSVAQVETAIPAFIGYTNKATQKLEGDLLNKPKKISSMLEFVQFFGSAPKTTVTEVKLNALNQVTTIDLDDNYYMYEALRLFYANGGGDCYIVSVGKSDGSAVNVTELKLGLSKIEKVDEPTLLLAPDACLLANADDTYSLYQAMLMQCGKLGDRFAILDVPEIGTDIEDSAAEFRNEIGMNNLKYGAAYTPFLHANLPRTVSYADIKGKIAQSGVSVDLADLIVDSEAKALANELDQLVVDQKTIADEVKTLVDTYSTADGKYLGLSTTLKTTSNKANLQDLLQFYADAIDLVRDSLAVGTDNFALTHTAAAAPNISLFNKLSGELNTNVTSGTINDITAVLAEMVKDWNDEMGSTLTITSSTGVDYSTGTGGTYFQGAGGVVGSAIGSNMSEILSPWSAIKSALDYIIETTSSYVATYENSATEVIPTLKTIKSEIASQALTLPPSAAIAGVYSRVDANRGVWKAPANTSLNNVTGVTELIDHDEQQGLNVDVVAGKSINAIRPFTGKGILVWGARTLAGNDNEWRYVSVRRFFNMVEESVKKATEQFVFEGNDANTWVKVRAMIENFLVLQWRAGALAGAKPEQAFFVRVGLGQTMTADDILNGVMNVEIGMAVVRPAEFIVLKFSHKMQES